MSTHLPTSMQAIWRWKVPIVLTAIVAAGVAYAVSAGQPSRYRATAEIELKGPDVSASSFVPIRSQLGPVLTISAGERLMMTREVASEAAARLSPTANPNVLRSQISVAGDANFAVLTVAASEPTAARAAAVANAFAAAFVAVRTARNQALIRHGIDTLVRERDALPRDSVGDRAALTSSLGRLRALLPGEASEAQIVLPAEQPHSPYSPRPLRDAALVFGGALLLAILLAIAAHHLDQRVRDPAELEELLQRPVIANLPKAALREPLSPSGAVADAFTVMSANLERIDGAHGPPRIIVASPIDGDGKTSVAAGLAYARARAGRDVVLVDADMRRRGISTLLGRADAPGLSEVIMGNMRLEAALSDVDAGGGGLQLLPSGRLPVPSARGLDSQRFAAVLRELPEGSDVIIDTPACLTVPDATFLFPVATGIVLVARVGSTPLPAVQLAAASVVTCGGRLLAIVATGVGSRARHAVDVDVILPIGPPADAAAGYLVVPSAGEPTPRSPADSTVA